MLLIRVIIAASVRGAVIELEAAGGMFPSVTLIRFMDPLTRLKAQSDVGAHKDKTLVFLSVRTLGFVLSC